MKTTVETIAKTKRGNFKVTAEITVNPKTDFTSVSMFVEIEGNKMPVSLHSKKDRILISDQVADFFGVRNSSNVVLLCDTSKVYSEKTRLHKEAEAKRFTGEITDSGHGFAMKNTKSNVIRAARLGFDAIEG